jgi:hypothetical protein
MRLEIRAMAVVKIRKWRVKRRWRRSKLPLSLLLMEGMALVRRRSSTLMVLISRYQVMTRLSCRNLLNLLAVNLRKMPKTITARPRVRKEKTIRTRS